MVTKKFIETQLNKIAKVTIIDKTRSRIFERTHDNSRWVLMQYGRRTPLPITKKDVIHEIYIALQVKGQRVTFLSRGGDEVTFIGG